MNQKVVKWLSLVSSLIAGVVLCIKGDPVTGTGIITAALSSASVLSKD